MRLTKIVTAAAVLALLSGATMANAATFTTAGQTAGVTLTGYDQDLDIFYPTVSADLSFKLESISGLSYNFSYTADNTSTDATARLIAFAFTVSPDVFTLSNVTGAVFSGGSPGNGGKLKGFDVDVCLYAGPNCNGGSNQGINSAAAAATGAFTLTFNGAPTNGVTLDGFVGKFQSVAAVNGNSLAGIPRVDDPCVTNPTAPGCSGGETSVPEPGTWALMILGFGGAGYMLRRRRTAFA